MKKRKTLAEQVLSKITVLAGRDACWEWTGWKQNKGYGQVNIDGKLQLAHRVVYEMRHGEGSAAGKKVLHSCDNPPCCNPAHLFLGTQRANCIDMINKGRARAFGRRTLSAAEVELIREARALGKSQSEAGRLVGVGQTCVSNIERGRAHAHTGRGKSWAASGVGRDDVCGGDELATRPAEARDVVPPRSVG